MTQITKITDLLTCKPIRMQLKEHKKEDILLQLMSMLTKCSISLGLSLTPEHINILSDDLIDKYEFESLEDIMFCLKKGRQGNYGNNYNKLNMIVISEWMDKHLEDKYQAKEKQLNNDKAELKEKLDNVDYAAYKIRLSNTPKEEKDTNETYYEVYKLEYLAKNKTDDTQK